MQITHRYGEKKSNYCMKAAVFCFVPRICYGNKYKILLRMQTKFEDLRMHHHAWHPIESRWLFCPLQPLHKRKMGAVFGGQEGRGDLGDPSPPLERMRSYSNSLLRSPDLTLCVTISILHRLYTKSLLQYSRLPYLEINFGSYQDDKIQR